MQFTNYCMCENACMHMYLQKCSFSNGKLSADLQAHSENQDTSLLFSLNTVEPTDNLYKCFIVITVW